MLTRRGSQFLEKVKKLYAETGEPVHYTAVAKLLGVSRWTAYDMLKSLERQGYVRAEYALNPGEGKGTGRSQVVFAPTARSLAATGRGVDAPEDGAEYLAEWHRIKEEVLKFFQNLRSLGPRELIEHLMNEVPNAEVPFIFCAYAVGLLVASASARRRRVVARLRRMLSRYARPELGLIGFAGTALGLLLGAAEAQSRQVEEAAFAFLDRFQHQLARTSHEERYLLFDFLKEALESRA